MKTLFACVLAWACCLALATTAHAQTTTAAASNGKKKDKEAQSAPVRDVNQPPPNACGCYSDSSGACRCTKKSKCGCPGECEPAGCEEKRAKELDKETREEIRKQQDEDRKRKAELDKRKDDLEKQEGQKKEKGLRGLRLIEKDKE
jgi:hypothetical protein